MKPLVAVDVDDVLALGTDALREQVNLVSGAALLPEHYAVKGDYWGYYERVWHTHGISVDFNDLNNIMVTDQSHIRPSPGALEALTDLSKYYRFTVVTARNAEWEHASRAWLDSNFPNIFESVHFAGRKSQTLSKGELCSQIGATWLIDDNIDHAHSALENGIGVILYGNYGWHIDKDVHSSAVRCPDWNSINGYLHGLITG